MENKKLQQPLIFLNDSNTLTLSNTQISLLNFILPARYCLSTQELKPPIISKSKKEPNTSTLSEKRSTREKEPDFLSKKSDAFKKCYKVLINLKKNFLSQRFFAPNENPEEENIDLAVIENKLISGDYLSAYHFSRDIRKMFNSQFLRNSRLPEAYIELYEFSVLFEDLIKGCESLVFSENIIQDLTKKVEKLTAGIKDSQTDSLTPKAVKEKTMTPAEKKQLCLSLKKLDPSYLAGVLKIVKGSISNTGGEFEFDLEKLPNKICRDLDKYIKQCLQFKPAKKLVQKDLGQVAERISLTLKNENNAKSDSEESSSSSSQSEEELPGAPFDIDMWDRDMQDFMNEKY